MDQAESKNDKFKRIATKRVRNAIKAIELIGKLSSSAYEYGEEEIEKIFSSMQVTLDATKSKFTPKKKEVNTFQL